jgi:hypothetical protein
LLSTYLAQNTGDAGSGADAAVVQGSMPNYLGKPVQEVASSEKTGQVLRRV